MKTKMRNSIVVLLLVAGINVAFASEVRNSDLMPVVVNEILVVEDWMLDASRFEAEVPGAPNFTVVEIAASNPDFSILVEAVTKAGLAQALGAEGPFTVFAPTNEAFERLFTKLGVAGIGELTAEQLTPILTYHVVPGKIMSSDLSTTTVGTLNEGNSLKVDLSSGVKVNDSQVIAADVEGTNGVIHVIDKVLLPE